MCTENQICPIYSTEKLATRYIGPDEIKKNLAKYGIDHDLVHQKQMQDHELLRSQLHL